MRTLVKEVSKLGEIKLETNKSFEFYSDINGFELLQEFINKLKDRFEWTTWQETWAFDKEADLWSVKISFKE